MDADSPDRTPRPPADEAYQTRASMFGRLNAERPADRETAWRQFRTKYAPMIASFAKRCGASRQDIDDIIQDVMTDFFRAADSFVYDPSRGRFRGWLKTCAVRAAIRRTGKNLRFQGVPLDAVPHVETAVEPLWNDVWERAMFTRALAAVRSRHNDDAVFLAFEQYVLRDRPPRRGRGRTRHQRRTRVPSQDTRHP